MDGICFYQEEAAHTVLPGFKAMLQLLANIIRPKLRYASIIGSYGWSSKAVEQIVGQIPNLNVEVLATVICKGMPKTDDFAALSALADKIAERHKNLSF